MVSKYSQVKQLPPGDTCMANDENGDSDIIMEHFTDPVHEHMSIHPVCVAIINTPQFQRLRYLKQLGTCYYVNTGSAHNRFEHSIGVCFVAGEFAETLQRNQPSLKITRKDILCVQIAGLCRGLGNGPFSHMFEDTLMPENLEIPWDVKQTSIKIFEDLIENKEVNKIFEKYCLDKNDIFFIKQMIFHKPSDGTITTGRENGKEFLEEIILNGIAAHTFDFLARDCFHLGIENTFNYKRYINLARVINVGGKNRICMEIEEVRNCIDLYTTRYTLTKYAYRHRVNIATQIMIAEIMSKVKDDFKINVEGKTYTVIESTNNMKAFMELDDNILFKILDMDGDTAKVKEAKALVERILKRDLYKCVWESPPLERACIRKAYVISGGNSTKSQGFEVEKLNTKSAKAIAKQIIEKGGEEGALTEDDFVLKVTSFDLGLQEENPLINMQFYSKNDPNTAVSIDKIEASRILKSAGGSEAFVRIYMRDTNEEKRKKIAAACEHWLKEIQVVKEITRQIARHKGDRKTPLEEIDFIVKLSDSSLEKLKRLEETGIMYSECELIKTDDNPNRVLSIKEGAEDLFTIDLFLINDTKRDAIADATNSWLQAKKEIYEELQKSGQVSNITVNYNDTSLKRSQGKKHKLRTASSKVFNDSLHGHIKINAVCLKIIDTPQFQRLRYIKQAGMLYFLHPGANHNRFEHSLGMCYLAGKFARKLQKRLIKDKKDNVRGLSKAEITDTDILCLEIAGLCYNLDQGPFSKLYSESFLPKVNREQKHGKRSGEMFQHILDTLNEEKLNKDKLNQDHVYQDKLDQKNIDIDKLNLEEYGLSPDDIVFIKELIGVIRPTGSTRWPYKGRPEDKSFLYEIISNRRNGIDVYKWDYMARDCRHTGIKNSFDYSRYMKLARVMEVDGELQICMRDKEALNLYNMFKTRYRLQKSCYQHRVVACLDLMVAQALKNADEHILIQGKKISECQDNVEALSHLTDYILQRIKYVKIDETQNETPELRKKIAEMKKAKEIINNIFTRTFFTCVYESDPLEPKAIKQYVDKQQAQEKIEKMIREKYKGTSVVEFFVELSYIDFGMKEENPLTRLKVYSKEDPHKARQLTKDETSTIMEPSVYDEVVVRIFSPVLDTRDLKKHAEEVVRILNRAAIKSQDN